MRTSAVLTFIGSLFGIVVALAVATCGGQATSPKHAERGAPLLHEARGSITEIVMHWTPGFREVIWDTYEDFWSAIDGKIRLTLVADQTVSIPERTALLAELRGINPELAKHTRWVISAGPITTWSKDRALVSAAPSSGPATLWVPEPPERYWPQRFNDWGTVASVAEASGGRFKSRTAPFDFDAGDFAVTDRHVIVGANFLRKNERRDIHNAAALQRRLSAWLDRPVLVLGEHPQDVPDHHLAMTMTPLDGRIALVGDPRMAATIVGNDFVPGTHSPETRELLTADFSEETAKRFDRLAADMKRAGYAVVRIPNIPLDAKTYITYTNGIYEVRGNRRVAYMPSYGIEALDGAARAVYHSLGFTVRPIRVARVYPYHGTIGCLVNILGRDG